MRSGRGVHVYGVEVFTNPKSSVRSICVSPTPANALAGPILGEVASRRSVGFGELCFGKAHCVAEIGSFETCVEELGAVEMRAEEVGPFEMRTEEIGPVEMRVAQVGTFHDCTTKIETPGVAESPVPGFVYHAA
jgi:hypothetical protein